MIGPCASGSIRKEDQRMLPNSTFIPKDFLFAFEIAALFILSIPPRTLMMLCIWSIHKKKPGKRKKILLFFQVQVLLPKSSTSYTLCQVNLFIEIIYPREFWSKKLLTRHKNFESYPILIRTRIKLSRCYFGLNIFCWKRFDKEWLYKIKSILNKNAVSIYHIVDVLGVGSKFEQPGIIIWKWLTYILLEEVETFSMSSFSDT